jgi:biotin carboxylase
MESRANAALPPGVRQVAQTVAPIVHAGVGGIKSAAQGQLGEPEGTAEKLGSGAEGIMEFVAGDEAAKGLSLAERLGLATKIAKIAEESPVAGKLIKAGLNAARVGAVGTTLEQALQWNPWSLAWKRLPPK